MIDNRTVGDVLLKMECDNRRLLRSLINIKMETAKITGNSTRTNCPNCGAPITGPFCKYCDTVFGISETEKVLAARENLNKYRRFQANDELYQKAINAITNYGHKIEFTSEEVDYINALMRIANLTASEARRLRGI